MEAKGVLSTNFFVFLIKIRFEIKNRKFKEFNNDLNERFFFVLQK